MAAIEPNWGALIGFIALALLCSVTFLVLTGMFPAASRPSNVRSLSGAGLIGANILLLMALAVLTGLYGWGQLRTTSMIIFGGLAILFAPGVFEAWPSNWRDSRTGLSVLMASQVMGIGALFVSA